MEAYTGFASVYDKYMDDIPYDTWADNIKLFFDKYNMPMDIVCDLGCGTGQVTRRLKHMGYDMIGIDMSYDMLMEAMSDEDSDGILYLCQDMRQFELYGTVGAIVSICDSMNYLRDTNELGQVCSLANNYLDPGGLFIFDLKTIHYFSGLGTEIMAANSDTGSYIWENDYDSDTRDNSYYLTIYEQSEDGLYERFEEEHLQHGFTIDEVEAAIRNSGLDLLEILDADTMEQPTDCSDRLYFIAREVTK